MLKREADVVQALQQATASKLVNVKACEETLLAASLQINLELMLRRFRCRMGGPAEP